MTPDESRAERIGNFGERQSPLPHGFGYFAHLSIYDYACGLASSGLFLDMGSGSGYGAAHVSRTERFEVLGLERQESLAAELRELYPGLRFAACDLNSDPIPVAAGGADLVFCSNVLEHVAYPDAPLAEAARVLAPGGCVLIAVPPISTVGEVRENAKNIFHITNLPQISWRTKLERFFEEVQPIRHWVREENHLPHDIKVLLGRGTAFSLERDYTVQDFLFEPVREGDDAPTLTAVFRCRRARARPLPPGHETPVPPAWRVLQVEAEARQEAMLALETALKTERIYWRGEVERLRVWIEEAMKSKAAPPFILEAILNQLRQYR